MRAEVFRRVMTDFADTIHDGHTVHDEPLVAQPAELDLVTRESIYNELIQVIKPLRRLPMEGAHDILSNPEDITLLTYRPVKSNCAQTSFSWSQHFRRLAPLRYKQYIGTDHFPSRDNSFNGDIYDEPHFRELISIEKKLDQTRCFWKGYQYCSMIFSPDIEGQHWGCVLTKSGHHTTALNEGFPEAIPTGALLRTEIATAWSMVLLTKAWHRARESSLPDSPSTAARAVTITIFSFTPKELRIVEALSDGTSLFHMQVKETFQLSDFFKTPPTKRETKCPSRKGADGTTPCQQSAASRSAHSIQSGDKPTGDRNAYVKAASWFFSLPKSDMGIWNDRLHGRHLRM